MAKTFKGQVCVYCGFRFSTRVGDHIFARALFLDERLSLTGIMEPGMFGVMAPQKAG